MKTVKFRFLVLALAISIGLVLSTPPAQVAAQANEVITGELCRPGATLDPTACDPGATAQSTIGRVMSIIVQTMVLVVGGISVIMIVVGGIRYVTSGGDPNGTKGAKDTIIYALVGLVVALVAQGLVTFVLSKI